VLPDALILVLCYQQVACPEMFSKEELICIAVLLDEEERKSRKRNRYMRVCCKEKKKGNILLCIKNLWKTVRFHQYFRMSESMYLNLLSLIEEDLTFREAISPKEK
jgi:hypothetical protein